VRTERHKGFHLLERMVVAADCLVERKERMWQITESGRLLILSTFGIERWDDISWENVRFKGRVLNVCINGCYCQLHRLTKSLEEFVLIFQF